MAKTNTGNRGGSSKGKASKKKQHSITWYRKEHERIPDALYVKREQARFEEERPTGVSKGKFKGRRTLLKSSYAPQGRPPSSKASHAQYEREAGVLTNAGLQRYGTPRARESYYTVHGTPVADRVREYETVKRKTPAKGKGKGKATAKGGKTTAKGGRASRGKRLTPAQQYEKERMEYEKGLDYLREMQAERVMEHMTPEEITAELEDRGYGDFRKTWKKTGKKTRAKAYLDMVDNTAHYNDDFYPY